MSEDTPEIAEWDAEAMVFEEWSLSRRKARKAVRKFYAEPGDDEENMPYTDGSRSQEFIDEARNGAMYGGAE